MKIIKTNIPGFVKDEESNAVINTNTRDFELYKLQREKSLNNKNEVTMLKSQVDSLSKDLNEIKQLLLLAIEKK